MTNLVITHPTPQYRHLDYIWEVHKHDCKDLRSRERFPTVAQSLEELVLEEYSGHMSDEDSPWTDYASEFKVMKCVGTFPTQKGEAR